MGGGICLWSVSDGLMMALGDFMEIYSSGDQASQYRP